MILQNDYSSGKKSITTQAQAGVLITKTFPFVMAAGVTAATDIIEIAGLPPGAQIVDAELVQVNGTGTTTYAVGFMSGRWREPDAARTVDDAIFSALRADTARRLGFVAASAIPPVDYARGIGVVLGTNEAAGATKVVYLTLSYHL